MTVLHSAVRDRLREFAPLALGPAVGPGRGQGERYGDLIEGARSGAATAVELTPRNPDQVSTAARALQDLSLDGFRHVSVHAPSRGAPPEAIAEALRALPSRVDAIVAHPDRIRDHGPLAVLGPRLVLENMNRKKADGRFPDELAAHFAELPEAGLCLDVAHVATLDPGLHLAFDLLRALGARLRQVHLSGVDVDGGHRPLTPGDVDRFARILGEVAHVPWILERDVFFAEVPSTSAVASGREEA